MKGNRVYILVVMLVLAMGAYVTEATAQPTVLTMCQSVGTGSYVLGNNISTTGTCFTLTGDNITIDLNGFTINGDDSGSDFGITDGGARQNIVIRNGTIRDFQVAIDLDQSDGCKVEWILAFRNTSSGIRVGDDCNVSHNIANNSQRGITHGSSCDISYNIANNNAVGIDHFALTMGSNIIYNTANGNIATGINVSCPSNLVGNTAQNNGTNLNQSGAGCKRYNNLF